MVGVIVGTVLQLMLAFFLFMLVAFSGGGVANGAALSKLQLGVLDFSLYALPASCLVSAGIVFYLYMRDAGPGSYWWHGLPVVATAVYVLYVFHLGNQA